ncbi:hypothetical protein [Pseudobutyrivibrio sp.]|uniref:hypothetical protein n=1 Tax=Pseudobutyrivibrio sp. TaxID=2014367 RepID=UPI001D2C2F27|nr:hypothetical protein [Pseudobutyrivibrio sp.]MBE5909631.1 hypothetical protein [Pseudobutyrivibrio sp.]
MLIKIGTKGSKLALVQTNYVCDTLKKAFPEHQYEIVVIKTTGDMDLTKPLDQIGSKGLFVDDIDSKIKLNKIVCYENKQLEYDNSEDMKEKISTCEMAIFTSGSNATFAIEQFGNNVPKKIISIGPACSKTIINLGYEVYKEAEISSYDGIMELLL